MAKLYVRKSDGTYVPQKLQSVTNIDVVQTTGNSVTATMSQDAVTKELAASQEKLSELESALSVYAEKDELTPEDKYGYVWGGELSDINVTDFRQKIFAVNKDDLLTITATITQINPNIPSIAFVENYVAGASAIILRDSTTGNANINYRPERDGYIIIFQSTSTQIGASNIQVVRDNGYRDFYEDITDIYMKIGNIKSDLNIFRSPVEIVGTNHSGYIYNGIVSDITSEEWQTRLFPVNSGDIIRITANITRQNPLVPSVAFVESFTIRTPAINIYDGESGKKDITYIADNDGYIAVLYSVNNVIKANNLLVTKRSGNFVDLQKQVEKIKNKQTSETAGLVLPNQIILATGKEFIMYAANICKNYNPMFAQKMQYIGGYFDDGLDTVISVPLESYGDANNSSVKIFGQDTVNPMFEKGLKCKFIKNNVGSGRTIKAIFIGDSITDQGIYTNELLNLFANDTVNLELYGTRGTGLNKHEGRSSWRAKTYFTPDGTADGKAQFNNSFYNPDSQTFDFSYYIEQQEYTGINCVFIALGSNELSTIQGIEDYKNYIDLMITSIRNYDANIKICIWMQPVGYYIWNGNRYAIDLAQKIHEATIEYYDGRESENIFVVPVYMSIDPLHDFVVSEVDINSRNSSFKKIKITDWVHPYATTGALKLADAIFPYLKYIISL